jgi:hypothetical protein
MNVDRNVLFPSISETIVQGCSSTNVSARLKEMGINRDMKPFSLPNNRFTLLNAELYNKQLLKHIKLKRQTLQDWELSKVKEFHVSHQGGAPALSKVLWYCLGPPWLDYSPSSVCGIK